MTPIETRKGALEMIEVAVDVRVIEFEAGQNRMLRPIMQKLRPFVEKAVSYSSPSRITCRPSPVFQPLAEIHRHAADKESGIESRTLEHPRRQRRRRRFAMGSGDDHEIVRESIRKRPKASGKEM
jgi:hypothetical protein